MSADHDTVDALRRLAKDRAATPAEKATARRLAKTLAAKIGKRPRRGRRKGHAALPEPPAARWRRQWIIRLEAVLHKIAVAGKWVHGVWIVSIIALVLVSLFGGEALRRQAYDIYPVRTLGLLAVVFAMTAIAGLLAFIAWWLRTWRNDRLRPALIFLAKHVLGFAIMAVGIGLLAYLEDRLKWPSLLGYATSLAVIFAICIPWWTWAYPAIERPSAGERRYAEGWRARDRGGRQRRLGLCPILKGDRDRRRDILDKACRLGHRGDWLLARLSRAHND